uniref:Tc1-like transposase DDE domain-containing protein n=1 Tax=Caenorhabditis japonica TaxID=281687 RepID=A0A8R1IPV5_CAEJA
MEKEGRTASNSSKIPNEINSALGLDVCSFFVPFFRNRRRSHTLQQDNAAIHSSNFTKNWLAAKGIKVLNWPACSGFQSDQELIEIKESDFLMVWASKKC